MANPVDDRIRRNRVLLGNPYAYLNADGEFDADLPDRDADIHVARRRLQNPWAYADEYGDVVDSSGKNADHRISSLLVDPDSLLRGRERGQRFTKREIQVITRRLLTAIWRNRSSLWPGQRPTPGQAIDPAIALKSIGYSIEENAALGQHRSGSEIFEVAGILDRSSRHVQVSGRYSRDIRNFTMAHELGHAILHEGSGLHRDRALDGSPGNRPCDPIETEANNFAAYFLMPEKQVRQMFERLFGAGKFKLTEDTAFGLTNESLVDVESRCRTPRDLARMLADAEYFMGRRFKSLANLFGVSIEAMAIRLEELELVDWRRP